MVKKKGEELWWWWQKLGMSEREQMEDWMDDRTNEGGMKLMDEWIDE